MRSSPRWAFRAFFFTAATVYGLLALGHAVDGNEDVWPGDAGWTVAYGFAAVACLVAGACEAKVVAGPRRWWWSVGLALTPLVFAVRLVAGVAEAGLDALEIGLLSVWAAAGLVWAAHLIRLLPANADEWDALADEVRVLRRDVADLQDHVGYNTERLDSMDHPSPSP